jgi:endonuclease/exonuclease/phosphatase family metal-dependent hydrolase
MQVTYLTSILCLLCFLSPVKKESKINFNDFGCSDQNEVTLLTLNTWGLPVWYGKSTDAKRYDAVVDALNASQANIICLQETFHPKLRNKLAASLDTLYKSFTDILCNRTVHKIVKMDCHGGLITYSKYPIVDEKFYVYPMDSHYSIIEETGRKGFLFTTININGKAINVVNTHLYSGSDAHAEEQRLKQAKYMDSILVTIPAYNLYPTILSGDMNIQHPYSSQYNTETPSKTYKFLASNQWTDSKQEMDETDFTYDPQSNKYAPKNSKRQILDYIFLNDMCCSFSLINESVVLNQATSVSDHNGYCVKMNISNAPFYKSDRQIASAK